MLYVVNCVDLKSLAKSNYSMDIHGVIGAGWSWMELDADLGTIKSLI
jgi:hypothetical protein